MNLYAKYEVCIVNTPNVKVTEMLAFNNHIKESSMPRVWGPFGHFWSLDQHAAGTSKFAKFSPSNTWFLGPIQVHSPSGIKINSSVFAWLILLGQTHRQT